LGAQARSEKAQAASDFETALGCLNAKAGILGLPFRDRLEMKREGFQLVLKQARLVDDSPMSIIATS
jgi:hypothetical protein